METAADIVALWQAHANGRPVTDTLADLAALRRRFERRSRSSVEHIDLLAPQVGDMSEAEWAAWWNLVCGWPQGFPPDPNATPARPTRSRVDGAWNEELFDCVSVARPDSGIGGGTVHRGLTSTEVLALDNDPGRRVAQIVNGAQELVTIESLRR